MLKKELSWKPRRRGATYCSPACGRGCTWKEHQAAKQLAEAIAKQLGPGWEPRVHESLGWHASAMAKNGYASASCHSGYFTVFINDSGDGWGGGRWYATARTARAALRGAIKVFKEVHDNLTRVRTCMEELMP